MSEALVVEECLVVDSTDSWIVDSGATNHTCNSLQVLQQRKKLNIGEFELQLGTGARVWS